jgi:membrane associated rhomboid family serine protease
VRFAAPDDEDDAPVWARADAFPKAPNGWGWVDVKARLFPCDTREALIEAIRADRDAGVAMVWTPDHSHLILPEELPEAAAAVLTARRRRAADMMAEAIDRLRWFGLMLGGLSLYILYQAWHLMPGHLSAGDRAPVAAKALIHSPSLGITLLMFLVFAFIPWYQARKRIHEIGASHAGEIGDLVPVLRFETWLEWQKAPVTRLMFVLTALVGIAQLLPGDSGAAAGLVKERYHAGEWWRLFTAPFLHGHPIHFVMNAAALLYLGRRIEVFARWPHVPLVFLFAACMGGEASARFLATTSVGASGGLMGWLGFLLVFESLHHRLVPRSSRRRLLAGVALTAVIGLVGYKLIDNAAHLGGLLAGMLYAAIVFPKSSSPMRPRSTITDRIAGVIALTVLTLSALLAAFMSMVN